MLSSSPCLLQVFHYPFSFSSSPVRRGSPTGFKNNPWSWGDKRQVSFYTLEMRHRWRWQQEWEIWEKTNQRTTLNYRKLFLILKPHSLKLLKKNGKIPIPSDVFFFSLEWKKTGGSGCVPTKRRWFFLSFLETHFPGNVFHQFSTIQGPAVQWAASLAWKDGAKVVADISRMEDPIFLLFSCSSCNPSGGGILLLYFQLMWKQWNSLVRAPDLWSLI